MALTDTALKAHKPRDKTYTVSDYRGLYLEVFPTGGMIQAERQERKAHAGEVPGTYPQDRQSHA
ncbi:MULTISPECIES: Arm DNA-binding domain-containing protein [Serratia]|uniref:Arm DNA-binding domain-containing protein n=1 Tax=Serratia TaxID=613 RepID=UPI0013D9B832|nr:Arm DNA-binding domain-containing protein [Serratia marcescens]MEB5611605.1 Arm DNA-binding domain-containing protein [Serratia marcescens]HBK4608035.1 DUF4102 domain-containing protein [Serratia marcescens]HBK4675269.1 DUF4102 domain-containing protein [Serratia marcescens]